MILTPNRPAAPDRVHYEVRQRVAVLTLDGPPVNGFSHALRADLLAGVYRALDDGGVDALVLTGRGRAFCAGGDVREFGTSSQTRAPRQVAVMGVLESSSKPVVAAINGICLGSGLELAMSCHYRVARQDALLGLPEIKLGLLPGGGGCQLLPRLLGLASAMDLILSGAKRPASEFVGTPLIDELVPGDPVDAAASFALRLVADGRTLRRASTLPVPTLPEADQQALIAGHQARMSPHEPAVEKCIEAILLSTRLDFSAGQLLERKLLLELMASPQSLAMRHLFAAERRFADLLDEDGRLANGAFSSRVLMRLTDALRVGVQSLLTDGVSTAEIGKALHAWGVSGEPLRSLLEQLSLPSVTPERTQSAATGIHGAQIVERCTAALANEGARLLEENIVQHAAQVDLVCARSLGFARHLAGPMLQADLAQLPLVVRALNLEWRRGGPDAAFWQPSPVILQAEREGASLAIQTPPARQVS